MLYLNGRFKAPVCACTWDLTLTSVVFECHLIKQRVKYPKDLTLTSVVFECISN